MPDWDEDGPELRANLVRLVQEVERSARQREPLSVETARDWHHTMMRGLSVPSANYVGVFRGEARLGQAEIQVLSRYGVPATDVAHALVRFEVKLQAMLSELDEMIPVTTSPDTELVRAIVDFCAWVHTEWVRIHPFANGNGRTARLWVNAIMMRYELPPFLQLRPRPGFGYGSAARKAMQGDRPKRRSSFNDY